MCQQGITVLVELSSVLAADAVYHKVVVEVVGINVGGDHHLITGERSPGQFQTNCVDLLGREIISLGEGLHEVVELPAVRFLKPLFGGHHLQVRRLGHAVASGNQARPIQHRLLPLRHIRQHTQHGPGSLLLISDGGEGSHQLTSFVSRRIAAQRSVYLSISSSLRRMVSRPMLASMVSWLRLRPWAFNSERTPSSPSTRTISFPRPQIHK